MRKIISVLILVVMLVSIFPCSAETMPVSGGDPARSYTFEELTGLSKDEIDHIIIRNGNDGIGYSTAYDKIITEVYAALNTKTFLPYVSEGNSGGWEYEINFFDKNNQSCSYNISKGVTPKSGFSGLSFRTQNEEELKNYEWNTGVLIADLFEERKLDPMAVPCVLCKNHGPFTWGKDAHEAVHNAVVLEEVAKMAARCEMINPDVKEAPQCLQDKHYLRKHGPGAYYGQGNL